MASEGVLPFGRMLGWAVFRTRAAATTLVLLASVLYCAAFISAQQQTFSGRVVAVIDGDTIGVMRDGREVRIRLEGIDAPEDGQDFSQRAKQFTSAAVFGKTIDVAVKETDRYGRLVARVIADGQDVSVALIEAGLAWHYLEYSKVDTLAFELELTGRHLFVNETGLQGFFVWDIDYGPLVAGRDRVEAAVREHLGIKLVSKRVPADVVVIDDVRMPTMWSCWAALTREGFPSRT